MGLFLHVLGTDTGVGKTVVTVGLARALREAGRRVAVVKPFATGAGPDGVPADTATIAAAMPGTSPDAISPWQAPAPLAPLMAAAERGETVPVAAVTATLLAAAEAVDVVVVEGIGGVRTPLAPGVNYLDFAAGLGGAAVVVARPGLGTLNHTQLTVEACRHSRVPVLGVICSHAAPEAADDRAAATNPEALAATLSVPIWPALPYRPGAPADWPPDALAAHAAHCAAALWAGNDALPLVHECITRVRYGETDQMGIVYHGDYFAWFDMGRTELLRARGLPYSELERRQVRLTVIDAGARYIAPAHYDEELRIRTELTSVRGVRLAFRYTIHRCADGVLVAEGQTTLACIDAAGRPRRLPAELATLLPGPRAARS